MRLFLFAAFFAATFSTLFAQKAPQKDQKEMDKFISTLMKKMTLDEKIGQLNLPSVGFDVITGPYLSEDVEGKIRKGMVGGVFNTWTPKACRKLQDMAVKETRLGIPLIFAFDVIHGQRTIFPQPIGLACSWDMDLIQRTARVAAEEAASEGLNLVFSPMVDICRDPRWGRVAEGAGEDAFLGSRVAEAMVKGYQGDDLSKNNTVMACVKHFGLYGAAEAGRDYNVVDMSTQRMYNYYLPPYEAAIKAGAGSVMASFNDINATPATGHKWLLTDLLRGKWGFDGLVMSDYTGIWEMVNHGIGDEPEAASRALEAGNDMDMVSELYIKHLKSELAKKRISQKQIDLACRRILEAKWRLGLFKDPYLYIQEGRSEKVVMTAEKLQTAREAAQKSIVLLKNERNTLPLDASKTIAFISPQTDRTRDLTGNWCGAGDHRQARTIRMGIEEVAPGGKFLFAKGCNLLDNDALLKKLDAQGSEMVKDARSPEEMIAEAVEVAKKADVVVTVLGEGFNMTGEAAAMSQIDLQPNQKALLAALKKTGKPLVLVLMNGRPLTIQPEVEMADAVVEAWFPGTMGGPAIADVLFGKTNPSGRLCISFPRNTGQIPIYYNNFSTGRPADEANWYTSKYLDVPNSPLFAFGHGLSYTRFEYSKMTVAAASAGKITASIEVKNAGDRDGGEVVQLYIRDKVGSQVRPLKELKGFRRIELKKGETRRVDFEIDETMLRFYDNSANWKSEDGEFEVMIGGASDKVISSGFVLKGGVLMAMVPKP